MADLTELTIKEISDKLASKEITSVEVTKAFLDRIETVDEKVGAFVTVMKEDALKAAEAADSRIASGDSTPLTGVPIALKDIFCTKGVKTTCSSKMLEEFRPPYDSTIVKKLKDSGAVILGKLNMDEFAMGSSTENSAFFKTKNPWDLTRVPGGSSGGSAASVAARMAPASLGTDTGGSIRQPASLCGVVGMKPSYGRISRYGMIAFASSLDQCGPLTQTTYDSAMLLNTLCGHDEMDSTSLDDRTEGTPDFTKGIDGGVKGLKIGLPKEYFIEGLNEEVEKSVRDGIAKLKELGAEVVDISLPHTEYAVSVYYVVATAECSSNLARFDGVKYGLRVDDGTGLLNMYKNSRTKGFGEEVKRRIMLGTYALSSGYYDAYYKKASQVRTLIKEDFENAFKECDVIITPTSPTTAFKFGERTDDPLTMYLSDVFTLSCSLAGLPGISIPCGIASDSMPIGMQIIGKYLDEATVLKTAHSFEQATDWHKKKADI